MADTPKETTPSIFKKRVEWIEGIIPRTWFFVVYLALSLVIIEKIFFWIASDFEWESHTKAVLGIVIWGLVVASKLNKFLASVPKVTGLLTVNIFTGELRPYPTGLHVVYPWEEISDSNFINMRARSQEIPETYPSLDGPMMLARWSFQYRPILELLPLYIKIGDEDIKKGMRDIGSSALSIKIANTPSDECKSEQKNMEEEIRNAISAHKPTPEALYGIELTKVALADLDYEASVQKARATADITRRINQIADAIMKDTVDGSITRKEAMDRAMVINGNVTKQIFQLEGVGPALDTLLKSFKERGN